MDLPLDSQNLEKPATKPKGKWGCEKGTNHGGGRKPSIAKLKAKELDIAKAQFWVDMAQTYAVPQIIALVKAKRTPAIVKLRAAEMILDRALGKAKETVDLKGSVKVSLTPEERLTVTKLFPDATNNV